MSSELLEVTEELYLLLIRKATGQHPDGDGRFGAKSADDARYPQLRVALKGDDSTKDLIPEFLNTCRSLDDFWQYIKKLIATYQGRKDFLREKFAPLFDFLEEGKVGNTAPITPITKLADEALREFEFDSVTRVWEKTLGRFQNDGDYDGAITTARSTVESVCKHVLSERGESYATGAPLPQLFMQTVKLLGFTDDVDTLEGLKQISIGFAKLRNANGDSHGMAPGASLPSQLLAEFVIHQAATLCWLLLKEHKAKAIAAIPVL